MGRQNIFKEHSVASVMPKPMIQDLTDFLITNRAFILSPEKKSEAFKTRFSGHSLVSDMVHRLTVLGKTQDFSLVRFPNKTVALREAVDMTFIPIDILQMKEMIPSSSKTLSLISELDDKLVINVTDITKSNNGDFSDVTQFHYRVVRDFLSRSFYTSSGNFWISPTLVRYVAKVYSMTIGGQIAKAFNLSPMIQSFIQTVFCAFFVGKMTSVDVAPTFMSSHNRFLGLPSTQDVTHILAFVQDTLGTEVPIDLEDVFKVIDAYDHAQLKSNNVSRLNRPILNMMFRSLYQEGHVATIALEYPPYFLFLILLVLSNVRIGLSFPVKKMNLDREGKDVFEQLVRSPTFL